jgi:hypothetical protein
MSVLTDLLKELGLAQTKLSAAQSSITELGPVVADALARVQALGAGAEIDDLRQTKTEIDEAIAKIAAASGNLECARFTAQELLEPTRKSFYPSDSSDALLAGQISAPSNQLQRHRQHGRPVRRRRIRALAWKIGLGLNLTLAIGGVASIWLPISALQILGIYGVAAALVLWQEDRYSTIDGVRPRRRPRRPRRLFHQGAFR